MSSSFHSQSHPAVQIGQPNVFVPSGKPLGARRSGDPKRRAEKSKFLHCLVSGGQRRRIPLHILFVGLLRARGGGKQYFPRGLVNYGPSLARSVANFTPRARPIVHLQDSIDNSSNIFAGCEVYVKEDKVEPTSWRRRRRSTRTTEGIKNGPHGECKTTFKCSYKFTITIEGNVRPQIPKRFDTGVHEATNRQQIRRDEPKVETQVPKHRHIDLLDDPTQQHGKMAP